MWFKYIIEDIFYLIDIYFLYIYIYFFFFFFHLFNFLKFIIYIIFIIELLLCLYLQKLLVIDLSFSC